MGFLSRAFGTASPAGMELASAAEKTHGPFQLKVRLDEIINDDNERVIIPVLHLETTKGTAQGQSVKELFADAQNLYEGRLQEKMAANTAARSSAEKARNNTAAAIAAAAAMAEQTRIAAADQATKKQKREEVLKFLKDRRYNPETKFLNKDLNPRNLERYIDLKKFNAMKPHMNMKTSVTNQLKKVTAKKPLVRSNGSRALVTRKALNNMTKGPAPSNAEDPSSLSPSQPNTAVSNPNNVENVKENVKPVVENVKENVAPAAENVKPAAKPAAIQLNKRQQSLVNAGYQSPGLKNRLRGKTRKVTRV
jgi:hypothetical protein